MEKEQLQFFFEDKQLQLFTSQRLDATRECPQKATGPRKNKIFVRRPNWAPLLPQETPSAAVP
jgi:hypothetical protein